MQQILWDIFELTFESVRNLGWISLVSPGIRASVYPHRQGTTCTPATPATHQASDVRWMTPWRYYRERNYKRKHIGITEDILISQQKLWSNFLWDTSLKLRYHTYGIAWRDDTYLLSNRMFHFQPGRHSTTTLQEDPCGISGERCQRFISLCTHGRTGVVRNPYVNIFHLQDLASDSWQRKRAKPLVQKLHQLNTWHVWCFWPFGNPMALWFLSKNYPHRNNVS